MKIITLKIKLGFILVCFLWINTISSFSNNNGVKIDLSKAKDTLIVQKITILGNKKTKPKIILNELRFKENHLIAKADLQKLVGKSKQNLRNTSLFNFVYINYWLNSAEEISFEIKVDERWYTWALPLFEQADRNFSSFLENGDWSRTNYGIYLKQENFRGMNEILKLKVRVGYKNEAELLYIPSNRNNKIGWGTSLNYNAHNQVSYEIIDNKAIYAKTRNRFIEQNLYSKVFLRYRHNYVHRHKLTFGYNLYHIADTLALLNPTYLNNGKTSLRYMSLEYSYVLDQRDSKTYPLRGNMFEGNFTQSGLGFLNTQLDNLSLMILFQQYGRISNRFFYGVNVGSIGNTSRNNPFVISNGLGYKEFLNGYEYNVIEGDNYAYAKNKVLFELVPTKTANINFINLNQFSKIHYAVYLKTFFDFGYVHEHKPHNTNSLTNSYLHSYGVGVDLVTYYDKVLSVNYSINKLGFKGFYVHLNLAM